MSPLYPLVLGARARALPSSWGHCPGWVAWEHGPGLPAHVSPVPQSIRRLFLTGKSCHLPPPGGLSMLPLRSQDKESQTCQPGPISCSSPAASALPFGRPKANSDHLFQPGPKWGPIPPPSHNSCQSFECLFKCHFLQEAYLEPPGSVPTAVPHICPWVYRTYPCGRTAVPRFQPFSTPALVHGVRSNRRSQGGWAILALKAWFVL